MPLLGFAAVAAAAALAPSWQVQGLYARRPEKPEGGLPEARLRCTARPPLLLGLQEQTEGQWEAQGGLERSPPETPRGAIPHPASCSLSAHLATGLPQGSAKLGEQGVPGLTVLTSGGLTMSPGRVLEEGTCVVRAGQQAGKRRASHAWVGFRCRQSIMLRPCQAGFKSYAAWMRWAAG